MKIIQANYISPLACLSNAEWLTGESGACRVFQSFFAFMERSLTKSF